MTLAFGPGRARASPLWLAASCLFSACADDDELRECQAYGDGAAITDGVGVSYSGRHGTAPAAMHGVARQSTSSLFRLEACGVEAGKAWQLVTNWTNLPPPAELPVDIGLGDVNAPLLTGHLRRCADARCDYREGEAFFTAPYPNQTADGVARVETFDPAAGRFVGSATITTRLHPIETTSITVDVHWSPSDVKIEGGS